LIIGAARQGQALARYLDRLGALVTLNDKRSGDEMDDIRSAFANTNVACVFGEHPVELLDKVQLVCLSGGVPLTLPIVQEAVHRKMIITNDSQIFMESVKAPVIGITGSAGKTTTTTLLGRMAKAAVKDPQQAWIGGNIGLPLVEYLDEIKADDLVILELSSFQLEQITISPNVAAVLNITPNHLDRHGTMAAYSHAKARILAFQAPADVAVLGRDDPGAWSLSGQVRGRLVSFGLQRPADGSAGTYLEQGQLWLQSAGEPQPLLPAGQVLLRGEHNLRNVLAACALAAAAGFPAAAMAAGVAGFGGVAHRLEWVRTFQGANWYNDSIATAPERTMAALHSFSEPLVLLLGGRDKDLPWEDLASLVRQRVDHVVVFGEAAPKILAALGPLQTGQRLTSIVQVGGLRAAVEAAAQVAGPGDVVLLSPGGTSFDEFNDFEERGERYREWVKQLL
jgi:UDP-N-acetylmuramoylalanine--D-glutamate ligase